MTIVSEVGCISPQKIERMSSEVFGCVDPRYITEQAMSKDHSYVLMKSRNTAHHVLVSPTESTLK